MNLDLLLTGARALVTWYPEWLLLLVFRAVPFIPAAVLARHASRASRLTAVVFCTAPCIAALAVIPVRTASHFFLFGLAYAYYGLLAVLVHFGIAPLRRHRKLLGFVLSFMLGFLAPCICLHGFFLIPFVLLGWDFVLASTSYSVESDEKSRFAQCAFFLLVDPTLIYTSRARPSPQGSSPRPIGRACVGAAFLLFGVGLSAAAESVRPGVSRLPEIPVAPYFASAILAFATLYALHSGLASLQIGLLRALGYTVSERYRFPFLARSPADFWRRWNTYVGLWFQRYVYVPSTLWMARALRAPSRTAVAGGVLVTFLAVGIAHNAVTWFAMGVYDFRITLLFGATGLAFLLWAWMEQSSVYATFERTTRLAGPVTRAGFILITLLVVWNWTPSFGLGSGGPPSRRTTGWLGRDVDTDLANNRAASARRRIVP